MTLDPVRVVAVADTDSYVKWAAALLGRLPDAWQRALVVVETPLAASGTQVAKALTGSGTDAAAVRRAGLDDALAGLRADPPDVVVIAGLGPFVRVVARGLADAADRPVLASGIAGISIPARRKALSYRKQCDLMLLHSHRERREFAAVAAEWGFDQRLALATLPFASAADPVPAPVPTAGTDLVFAAQAVVPLRRADRLRVARMLVAAAEADPGRRVVVKLRAVKGEQQTHAESDAYPDLIASLGAVPSNLVFSTAPMRSALDTAEGLVTVSSTAAIEALVRGLPVIALDVFGVGPELVNDVFTGSGLFGDEADVAARRFRHPQPGWLADNYLHPASDDDAVAQLSELVQARRRGELPARQSPTRGLRAAWERRIVLGSLDRTPLGAVAGVIGPPARLALRSARRLVGA